MQPRIFWQKIRNVTLAEWYRPVVRPCEECNDFGIVDLVRNGQVTTIECHCSIRTRDQQILHDAIALDQFPTERYGHANFDTTHKPNGWSMTELAYFERAILMLYQWSCEPKHNIVFLGNVGVGKTHMAAVAYNEVRQILGLRPIWLSVTTFVGQMAAMFSRKDGLLDEQLALLSQVPILILDDLGRGGLESSPGVTANIYKLINNRYNALLPTVTTTNLLQSEMTQRTPAIADRLFEKDPNGFETIFPLQGKSYRQVGGAE